MAPPRGEAGAAPSEASAPAISCLRLDLEINDTQHTSLSLDGELTAEQITGDLSQHLVRLGYDAAGARFIDPLWPPQPDSPASELGLEALVRRLASALAPGGDVRRARLLPPGAAQQGTAELPMITIRVMLQPARSRGTPAPRSMSVQRGVAASRSAGKSTTQVADSGGRGAPSSGGGARAAAGAVSGRGSEGGGGGSGGDDDDWDDDDQQAKQRRRNKEHSVLGPFSSSWLENLQKYWPAISKDDGKKTMYLLKEDFSYVMIHVTETHTSQGLLRAILASTLWDTVVTVGPDAVLGLGSDDIKSMNTIVNNWVGALSGSFRRKLHMPTGKDDDKVAVWFLFKNFKTPYTRNELESWEDLWDEHAPKTLDKFVRRFCSLCKGSSITSKDIHAVVKAYRLQQQELPARPPLPVAAAPPLSADSPSPSAAAKNRHKHSSGSGGGGGSGSGKGGPAAAKEARQPTKQKGSRSKQAAGSRTKSAGGRRGGTRAQAAVARADEPASGASSPSGSRGNGRGDRKRPCKDQDKQQTKQLRRTMDSEDFSSDSLGRPSTDSDE